MTVIGIIPLVILALLGISTVIGLLLLCLARSRLRIFGILLLALPLLTGRNGRVLVLCHASDATATF